MRKFVKAAKNKPHNPTVTDLDGIDRITFDSVGQAVIDAMTDYAQNESNRVMLAGRMVEHLTGRDDWANYYTLPRLLAAIANPPRHLLDAVDEMRQTMVDEICPPVTTRRRVRRNQEFGDELTPESVLARSLTPWERMDRENQPRRTVTIGVNLSVSCSRRPEELLWRGAAAAALADILTQRGVNVEIVAFWSVSRMSASVSKVVARYVVKPADMPLDIGTVALALSEIAFARIIALYGLARHVRGALSFGLGMVDRLPYADAKTCDFLAEANITTREAAEAWLRKAANVQEGEVAHA